MFSFSHEGARGDLALPLHSERISPKVVNRGWHVDAVTYKAGRLPVAKPEYFR